METVVMASGNKKKVGELSEILRGFGMNVISKDEAGFGDIDPVEDGDTYEENSLKKAREIMEACGHITLADDSGLEVESLGGIPSVHSARFAGEDCNYDRNNEKLLGMLKGAPISERRAKFVTVITMVFPAAEPEGEKVVVARGECPGHITEIPRGEGGFGYDPIFVPDGYDKTFAELGPEIKNQISHRSRAISELVRILSEN